MNRHKLLSTTIGLIFVFSGLSPHLFAADCDGCTPYGSSGITCLCGRTDGQGGNHLYDSWCEGVNGTIPVPVVGTMISQTPIPGASTESDRCEDSGSTVAPTAPTCEVTYTEGVDWEITIEYCGTFSAHTSTQVTNTFSGVVAPPCSRKDTNWYETKYNCTVTIPVTYTLFERRRYEVMIPFEPNVIISCNSVSQDCGTVDSVASGTWDKLTMKSVDVDCPECPECTVNDPPANL